MEFIRSTETLEVLPCGVALYEFADGKVLRRGVNTAFAKTLGFADAEKIDACPNDAPLPYITPDDLPLRQAMVERALAGENDYKQQLHMRLGDNRMGVMELCVHIEGQRAYVSISDVTQLVYRRCQLDVLARTISDGMGVFKRENNTIVCVTCNDTLPQMLGYTTEEFKRVMGQSARQLVRQEDRPAIYEFLCRSEDENQKISREVLLYKKDRSTLWLRITAAPFEDVNGKICCCVAFTDVSAEKRELPEKKDYLTYLDQVLGQLPVGILTYQMEGRGVMPINANECALALLGYQTLKELQAGTRFGQNRMFWEREETKNYLRAAMDEGKPQRFLNHYKQPNGGKREFSVTFRQGTGFAGGKLLQVTMTDITEQERHKAQLQALEDSVSGGGAVFRISDHFRKMEGLHISDKLLALLGHDADQPMRAAGSCYADIFPEDRETVRQALENTVKAGKKTATVAFRVMSGEKPFTWVNAVYTLLQAQEDSYVFYGLYTDVTKEHYYAEYVQGLTNAIPGGVAVYRYDPERGKLGVEYSNGAMQEMLGYGAEEYSAMVGMEQSMRVYETDRESVKTAFRTLLSRLEPTELTYRVYGKRGLHWVRAHYTPHRYDTGVIEIFAVFTDIDREMRQEETLGAILNNAPGGIAMSEYDIKTRKVTVTYANAELKSMMSYPQDNLLERRWSEDMFCDLPENLVEEVRRKYQDCAFRGVRYENLLPMRRQDGKMIWIRVVVTFTPGEKNRMRSYGIYIDITALMESEQKLSRMNERFRLLLEATHTITFDYSSETDTLEYSVFAKDGRHLHELTPEYRATRPFDPQISPEHRQLCLDAYAELLENSGVRTLEIQSTYFTGGDGYGWNRVNMMSMAEPDGSITHVIGRIDNIQSERDQEKNFDQVLVQHKTMLQELAYSYCLNLTRGVVEESYTSLEGETILLPGAPIDDASFENMFKNRVTAPMELRQIVQKFCPSGMMTAFERGVGQDVLEYRYTFPNRTTLWMCTRSTVMQNPKTGDVIAFLNTWDVQQEKMMRMALQTLTNRDYKLITLIDVKNGHFQQFDNTAAKSSLRSGDDYSAILRAGAEENIPEEERKKYLQKLSLANICKTLQEKSSDSAVFDTVLPGGEIEKRKYTYLYANAEQDTVVVCSQDVTDVVRAQQEHAARLEKAMREARASAAAKSEFLSRMSHEMRTPLNAVLGLAKLGVEESGGRRAQGDFRDIYAAGEYLLGLINDILDMSKIESGKVKLTRKEENICEILQSVTTMAAAAGREYGVTIETAFDVNPEVNVMADAMHNKQIMMNLLNNAVKFSPEGSVVHFAVQGVDNGDGTLNLTLQIKDHGCGMSEEFQAQMYQPFAQGINEYSDRRKGTGLGLAIVKSLVELMDGTIECRSKPGEGTEFRMAFKHLKLCAEKTPKTTDAKALACLRGKRVLLCEDVAVNAKITARLLEKAEVVTEFAENGAVGVEKFAASEPGYYDAILMDMRMPVMDGVTAAQHIRTLDRPDADTVPVIALTANTQKEDLQRTRKAGMNAYIVKPFSIKELYRTLGACLQ